MTSLCGPLRDSCFEGWKPDIGMIEYGENSAHQSDVILAQANFSLQLDQLLKVILGLAALTLAIAAFLALKGFWPVLAIAVLQVVIVALTLFTAWRNSWQREIVEIGDEKLLVIRQQAGSEQRHELQTYWARVETEPGRRFRDPIRVFLKSREQRIELGRFLCGDEREALEHSLRRSLLNRTAWQAN